MANPRTLFLLTEDDRRKVYGALGEGREGARQDEKSVIAESALPIGTLLAYSTSWEDCSEVVLRLPEAENVDSYPETPPGAATGRETGQKQGSNESSTPEIEPWDPVMDPLGPRNWAESPKN